MARDTIACHSWLPIAAGCDPSGHSVERRQNLHHEISSDYHRCRVSACPVAIRQAPPRAEAGGLRLFHPQPGSVHVMFLKSDSGYLRTVGDDPNYDIEIPTQLLPSFLKVWRKGYGSESDLTNRIVAVLLKTYFESFSPRVVPAFGARTSMCGVRGRV